MRLPSCSCIFFSVLLVVAGYIGWSVAATGLVQVPVLSSVAFHEPTPEHKVEPAKGDLDALLASQLVGISSGKDVTLTIPESMLTKMVQSVPIVKGVPLDLARSQIAAFSVEDGGEIEFFAQWKNKPTALTARFRPEMQNGKLRLVLTRLHVGNWRVPGAVVRLILSRAVNLGVDSLMKDLSRSATITAVEVGEGTLKLSGTPKTTLN